AGDGQPDAPRPARHERGPTAQAQVHRPNDMRSGLKLGSVTIPPGLSGMLNAGVPVKPRAASSVLVVDHHKDPWTLLMMRRPDGADFAPGAYVFAGGSRQPEDEGFEDPHRATAVRELFEEVGILLARSEAG